MRPPPSSTLFPLHDALPISLSVNLFFEKAELEAGVKPRATTHPSQPVIQSGQAITVDPMLPAIGALLPFTTKPMPFPWCGSALRTIHVLLLPVHGRPRG